MMACVPTIREIKIVDSAADGSCEARQPVGL